MYASMAHDNYSRKAWTWKATATHDTFGGEGTPQYHMWNLNIVEREREPGGTDNTFVFSCRDVSDLLQLEEAIRAAILDLQVREGVVQEVDLGTVGAVVRKASKKTVKEVTA